MRLNQIRTSLTEGDKFLSVYAIEGSDSPNSVFSAVEKSARAAQSSLEEPGGALIDLAFSMDKKAREYREERKRKLAALMRSFKSAAKGYHAREREILGFSSVDEARLSRSRMQTLADEIVQCGEEDLDQVREIISLGERYFEDCLEVCKERSAGRSNAARSLEGQACSVEAQPLDGFGYDFDITRVGSVSGRNDIHNAFWFGELKRAVADSLKKVALKARDTQSSFVRFVKTRLGGVADFEERMSLEEFTRAQREIEREWNGVFSAAKADVRATMLAQSETRRFRSDILPRLERARRLLDQKIASVLEAYHGVVSREDFESAAGLRLAETLKKDPEEIMDSLLGDGSLARAGIVTYSDFLRHDPESAKEAFEKAARSIAGEFKGFTYVPGLGFAYKAGERRGEGYTVLVVESSDAPAGSEQNAREYFVETKREGEMPVSQLFDVKMGPSGRSAKLALNHVARVFRARRVPGVDLPQAG